MSVARRNPAGVFDYLAGIARRFDFSTKFFSDQILEVSYGIEKPIVAAVCHLDQAIHTRVDQSFWRHTLAGAGFHSKGHVCAVGISHHFAPAVAALYALDAAVKSGNIFSCGVRILFGFDEVFGLNSFAKYGNEVAPDKTLILQGVPGQTTEPGSLQVRFWLERSVVGANGSNEADEMVALACASAGDRADLLIHVAQVTLTSARLHEVHLLQMIEEVSERLRIPVHVLPEPQTDRLALRLMMDQRQVGSAYASDPLGRLLGLLKVLPIYVDDLRWMDWLSRLLSTSAHIGKLEVTSSRVCVDVDLRYWNRESGLKWLSAARSSCPLPCTVEKLQDILPWTSSVRDGDFREVTPITSSRLFTNATVVGDFSQGFSRRFAAQDVVNITDILERTENYAQTMLDYAT